MVVQAGQIAARPGAEVDIPADKLLDDRAENIGLDHGCDLVAKLELLQNLLDVGGEAVEIRFKVRLELLACRAAGQIAQAKGRRIAEGLPGGVAQRAPLVGDTRAVQHFFHIQNLLLGILQHSVQAADDRHGQNNIAVLPAHIHIPQAIVSDAPDEIGNGIEQMGIHSMSSSVCNCTFLDVILNMMLLAILNHFCNEDSDDPTPSQCF